MSVLASLQQALQTHLLAGDEAIVGQLAAPKTGSIDTRLAVYANAYLWRLIGALQQEYGLLAKLVGEEAFIEMAEAFVDQCPSRFCSITEFTKPLAHFLFVTAPYSEKPYLSEVARLIKALSFSLEAADASVLNQQALFKVSAQSWPSLSFKCHPSVQCLSFAWNSFALWQALMQGKTTLPTIRAEASYAMVWRKELQFYAVALTEVEVLAFEALQAGSCFSDICEVIYSKDLMSEAQVASFLANLLMRWLNDHLLSEVYLS